ncbi:energy transducer TonB [Candidatus Symbiopectobacterium sp. 'North America']|uniref:energy transducer TonB n=1 Tax=Candidatus Symbiopectobacterium sp. 'North America' TaxID=2794574 RepID=UPI0018C94F3C|nr:TonB family protein [Candidatus Symbiopectobacterium sp. 'North America']
MHTHLAKFKRYPRAALRYRATGISHISMVLNAQGQVIDAAIVTSSGNRILDNEALDIVKRAAPLPHELNGDGQVQVVAPISFYL